MFDRDTLRPENRLLGINEVAARLNMHTVTIYHKVGRGVRHDPDFPQPIRTLGTRLKWRESAICDYIDRHERQSAAA